MKKVKKLLVLLLSAMLIMGCIMSTYAEGEGEDQGDENITLASEESGEATGDEETGQVSNTVRNLNDVATIGIAVNDESVTDGSEIEITYGEKVKVSINWNIRNSNDGQSPVTIVPGDSFTYQIPSNVDVESYSGNLSGYGTYVIEGRTLTITYTDEAFCSSGNRKGSIWFDATLNSDAGIGSSGGNTSFEFVGVGTIPVKVNPNYSGHNVTVAKSYNRIDAVNHIYEYTLQLTSTGKNNNIVVTDTLGSYLTLDKDSVKFYTDWNGTKEYTNTTPVKDSVSDSGFKYTIPYMNDGEVIYVKYQAQMSDDAYSHNTTSSLNSNLTNKATVSSDETSEKSDTKVISINKVWANKTGTYDEENDSITWVLVINDGDYVDMSGTVLKDVLKGGLELPTSIKVEEAAYNSNTYTESSLKITPAELFGDGYTFPNGSDKKYKITYTTKVKDTPSLGTETRQNGIIITPMGSDNTISKTPTSVTVGKEFNYIEKECLTEGTPADGIYTWKITLHVPSTGSKNVYVEDAIPNGMTYVEDSFKITGTPTAGYTQNPPVVGDVQYGKLKITFGDMTEGDLEFEIKTQVNTETTASTSYYTNTVNFYSSEANDQASANATYTVENFLSKSLNYTESKNSLLVWDLIVSKLSGNPESVIITDTIPENTVFSGDVKIYNESYTQLLNFDGEITTKVSEDGKSVTFTLGSRLIERLKQGNLILRYGTKINDIVGSGNKEYKNKAQITIDGNTYPEITASGWYEQNQDIVKKSANYTVDTAPNVEYTVVINPDALNLDPDSDVLTLEDTMGSALSFVNGSLKINGKTASASDYEIDFVNNKLIIKNLPDETAITVEYQAQVLLAANGENEFDETNGVNSCVLKGINKGNSDDEHKLTGLVLASRGQSSASGVSLEIYKYGNGHTSEAIEGAVFAIDALEFDREWKVSKSSEVASQLKTDSEGNVTRTGLNRDTVYRVYETKAASGYILDKTPQYIVFAGEDNIEYPKTVTDENGKTFDLTVVDSEMGTAALQYDNEAYQVSILKTDITGEKEVSGATLTLFDEGGEKVTEWVSTDEAHALTGLEAGVKYTLKETGAPDGYAYAADIEFTLESDGTITIDEDYLDEDGNIIMKDDTTKVEVSKVSDTSKDQLVGAVLQIKDKAGKVVCEWTTTADVYQVYGKLVAGETYTLHEVSAPEGYDVAEDISFTVGTDGKKQSVEMTDAAITVNDEHKVNVKKTDISGEKEVSGATLTLFDENGDKVTEWVSTDEAHEITGLEAGVKYTLKETGAPDGYAYAADIEFTLESDGTITIDEDYLDEDGNIIMKDDTTKVEVSKVSDTSKDQLVGAVLQIKDKAGKVVCEWTTTADVYQVYGKLVAGEIYTLHEVSAPEGYDVADDISFTVGTDGKEQIIEMVDAKIKTGSGDNDAPENNSPGDDNPNNDGDNVGNGDDGAIDNPSDEPGDDIDISDGSGDDGEDGEITQGEGSEEGANNSSGPYTGDEALLLLFLLLGGTTGAAIIAVKKLGKNE